MQNMTERFEQAITLFEQQKYQEAFMAFCESYDAGIQRKEVMTILMEGFYRPNLAEMEKMYQNNIVALQGYPYLLSRDFKPVAELNWQVFPIDDGIYRLYDKQNEKFGEVYHQTYEQEQIPYYFKQLDKPLLVENEYNVYNLQFLVDNVRASEDHGGDNHIYLYYESLEKFCCLLQMEDWTTLLQSRKLVFLFGEEEKAQYPLDFKMMFGIDYSKYTPQPVRIDEVKRLILEMQVLPNAGNVFLEQILDHHPDLLTMGHGMTEFGLFYEAVLREKTVAQAIETIMQCVEKKEYSKVQTLFLVFGGYEQKRDFGNDFSRLIGALMQFCSPEDVLSKRQWLIVFYLAYAQINGRDFSRERIVPTIVFGLHYWYIHPNICYEMIEDVLAEFPYKLRIGIIRDPLSAIGSNINMGKSVDTLKDISYFMNLIGSILEKDKVFQKYERGRELMKSYLVRFEDLKLNTKATLSRLAEILNIPFTASMLDTTKDGITTEFRGTTGFDPSPIYKKRREFLNDFDRFRLEMVIWKYYEPFGYKPKLYDGMRYSDEDVRALLEMPFRFEEYCTEVPEQAMEESRKLFVERAMVFYKENFRREPYRGATPMAVIWPKEELIENPLYE